MRSGELSELDRAIGDGDHGTTMARAVVRIRERLEAPDAPAGINDVLDTVGTVFLDLDGGATGPLFGTFFAGMSSAASDRDRLDASGLATMFEAGLTSLHDLSRASLGDKTMLDALIPAVDAARAGADGGATLSAQLSEAAGAAEAGADSTRELLARYGRAKHLGDRVLGHEDPGARSVAILFRGLSDEVDRLPTMEGECRCQTATTCD
jgi:dihydroxyacetone kinase-like protein